jgi:hypothetical protein
MINKMFSKISMLIVLSIILGCISVRALANTAPVWGYTTQPEIGKFTIDPNLFDPGTMLAIDVNNDGDLDIVTIESDYSYYNISWYDGSDDWSENVISEDESVTDINSGDIDGDGDLDLIVVSANAKRIYWYENGNQWAKTEIYNSYFAPSYAIPVDMDNDGDLDVVVSYTSGSRIYWYENTNQSRYYWTQHEITRSVDNPQDIIATDIDDDGDLDILSVSFDDDEIVWYENGNAWNETVITTSADGVADIEVADIDGDGDLDIVATSYFDSKVSWYEKGNSWNETIIPTITEASKSITVADMDGDGDLDVLSAPYNDGGVIGWYENGNNWNEHVLFDDSTSSDYIITADIDKDNDQDVLLLSKIPSTSRYYAYLLKVAGYDSTPLINIETLDGQTDITLPVSSSDAEGDELTYAVSGVDSGLFEVSSTGRLSFITAPEYHLYSDSNNDNFFDIILTVSDGELSNLISLRINLILDEDSDNDGISDTQELLDGTDPADYNSKLDTDGDGVPDRLEPYFAGDINTPDAIDSDGDAVSDYTERFYGENDAPVWLSYLNNSEHWLEKDIIPSRGTSYDPTHSVAVADVTGDGVKDILSSYDDSITIFNGASNFSTTEIESAASNVSFITVADLTNDGVNNPDVIVTEGYSNSSDDIYWYEYNTWIRRPISTSNSIDGDIKVQDMDLDGDLDIVAVTDTQIVWYENGNTWLEHAIIDIDFTISRFEIIDFDFDGDIDIVATANDIDEVIWFENDTSWQKRIISSDVENPSGLAINDIDDDGSLDIVVTSTGNSFILLQDINGWQKTTLYSLYDSDITTDVVITDMNNDGVLDIVGSSSDSVVWFDGANYWSRIIINSITGNHRIIVEDLTGDAYKDVVGSSNTYWVKEFIINVNTNIVSNYSLDLPDLSTEINLPFVALEVDGQDLTYSLGGVDAKYFKVDSEGLLSLSTPVSIGTPVDFNGDNIFDIELIASDGVNQSTVYITLNLVESIDTDGDGILDTDDIDDDNDLVPDAVEIEEGTDPLDVNSFLDEDRNGVPDFVQRSEAQFINFQFPLGVSVDEGGFVVVDLSNVTSVNGPVSIDVGEIQGLNYKFRDNVLYIYADYVSSNQTINIDITLSDGVEVVKHVFPVYVINILTDSLKIELIREATAINDGIRLQVAVKNILAPLDFKWYIDGELLTSENSQIFTLKENHFTNEDVVVKIEVSNDGFVSKYTDGIELNRTSFLAEVAQAQTEQLESEPATKNVAGSTGITSLVFAISLLLLRRIRFKIVNPKKIFSKSKLILTILMMLAITACSSTTDTNQHQLSPQLSAQTQTVNISLDESDPLYIAKQEYEAGKEQAKLEKLRRKIELEVKERNERVHILTIGF